MAENEVLDVGYGKQYRRWRHALADASLSPAEIAQKLSQDFASILRSKLRGEPFYLVLKACGQDRVALQEAVGAFKNRTMAKLVEQAFKITKSTDPSMVATKMADLLIARLRDKANCYALQHRHNADATRHAAIEVETAASLEKIKPRIVEALTASLSNRSVKQFRRPSVPRPTPQAVLDTSLRPIARKPLGDSYHA